MLRGSFSRFIYLDRNLCIHPCKVCSYRVPSSNALLIFLADSVVLRPCSNSERKVSIISLWQFWTWTLLATSGDVYIYTSSKNPTFHLQQTNTLYGQKPPDTFYFLCLIEYLGKYQSIFSGTSGIYGTSDIIFRRNFWSPRQIIK